MASHFSANQFDREFSAPRLCNWEVPKWHRARPVQRKTCTKIISNNRGHLLPGIARPKSSPWGNFKCTWELPDKITKQQAIELNSPIVGLNRWNKPSVKNTTQRSNKLVTATLDENKQDLSYTPGNLTVAEQQHHSRSFLNKKSADQLPVLNSLYVENTNCSAANEAKPKSDQKLEGSQTGCQQKNESILKDIKKLSQTDEKMRQEVSEKPGESNTIPLIPAYYNFQTARKMAQENLEHQPLPDSIMDRAFRKMQAQGILNPELALDVEPIATGVGVKTYNAGPTHCTKLKVYRPKTCGIVPRPLDQQQEHFDCRPQTAFGEKTKIGPMDLAICWDYRPANPRDEPKPPPHIDGSNGSIAPAVFTLVKTPRTTNEEHLTGRSNGVFSNTMGEADFFDKDIMMRNRNYFSTQLEKNTNRVCRCSNSAPVCRPRSTTRHVAKSTQLQSGDRCKSSPNLSILAQASDATVPKDNIILCTYNKEHYHYRPESGGHHGDLNPQKQHVSRSKKHKCGKLRQSRLCEQNIDKLNETYRQQHPEIKAAYKFAFKAGVPKSNSSGVCSSLENSSNGSTATASEFTSKLVKIPKPRNPYAKKNYVIDTLAPPFACWKGGAGQGGYPEHWRLASVYQHAYKPVEQRKRPLLATVYQ